MTKNYKLPARARNAIRHVFRGRKSLPPKSLVREKFPQAFFDTPNCGQGTLRAIACWLRGLPQPPKPISVPRKKFEWPRSDPRLSTNGVGGELIPVGFSNELDAALKQFGGMFQVARIVRQDNGSDVAWPSTEPK